MRKRAQHRRSVREDQILNVSVKFKGCRIFGSAPCSNGTEEGEIQVNTLKGELGYINASEHKVGVRLDT